MKFNKEALKTLPPKFIKQLKRMCPSFFWVPNRAQARAFLKWMKRPYPRVHIITYGNRTGKTEWLAQFLTGAARGKTVEPTTGREICYVNPEYSYSPFFDDLEEKRLKGTLTIWWICEADMMKKNGPDYKIIAKHMPDAKFKSRTNNGVYREVHVPVKGEGGKPYMLVISVKTHDQDTISFAGDNVDLIICDEPPPQKHWSEISGRMVTLKGEMGGRIIIGGTPLKMGAFLLDIIEEAEDEGDSRVVHDEGSIWENCAGDELPDDIAEKYGIPKGPDGIYETNGHLTCEGIENAIKNWEKSGDPDEIHARVDGKFTHAQGRIYKIFSKSVHVIEPYEIPDNYPIVQIVDPHDSRPDAAGWFAITAANKLICIAEYPEAPFENFTTRPDDIIRTCEAWREIERRLGIQGRIYKRYADPHYMNDPDSNTLKRKWELYAPHGFKFNLHVNSNIEYGHEKVRRMLWYDRSKYIKFPGDPAYQPHLLFFSTCRNHIKFVRNYGTKPIKDPSKDFNETPEKKWKCFSDIVRYAAVTFKSFEIIKGSMDKTKSSEWEQIKAARHPHRPQGGVSNKYQNRRTMIMG
jgi:hypothetical protein